MLGAQEDAALRDSPPYVLQFQHRRAARTHGLRLRPREGHELRVESVDVRTTPASSIRWSRDVEDNSVAIATFELPAHQLMIESHVIVQQYNQAPFDFLLADQAANYPFTYPPEDAAVLAPYMTGAVRGA